MDVAWHRCMLKGKRVGHGMILAGYSFALKKRRSRMAAVPMPSRSKSFQQGWCSLWHCQTDTVLMPLVQVDTVETGKRGESPRPTTWHLPIRFGLALSVYTVCPPFGTPAPVPPTLAKGGTPAVVNQSLK
jgi:hypothetical protein